VGAGFAGAVLHPGRRGNGANPSVLRDFPPRAGSGSVGTGDPSKNLTDLINGVVLLAQLDDSSRAAGPSWGLGLRAVAAERGENGGDGGFFCEKW